MKSTFFAVIALLTGAVANAQADTTKPQTDTAARPQTDTTVVALVDTSVGKAYVTNPDRLRSLTSETLTPADIFPALGTYKGSGTSTEEVTVTLDETNRGIVWIEGLPQGRFKALMKKAPATYKIPSQKNRKRKSCFRRYIVCKPGDLRTDYRRGSVVQRQRTDSRADGSHEKEWLAVHRYQG